MGKPRGRAFSLLVCKPVYFLGYAFEYSSHNFSLYMQVSMECSTLKSSKKALEETILKLEVMQSAALDEHLTFRWPFHVWSVIHSSVLIVTYAF